MESKRRVKNFFSTVVTIVLVVALIVLYRKFDFNYYSKGIISGGSASFSIDDKC